MCIGWIAYIARPEGAVSGRPSTVDRVLVLVLVLEPSVFGDFEQKDEFPVSPFQKRAIPSFSSV